MLTIRTKVQTEKFKQGYVLITNQVEMLVKDLNKNDRTRVSTLLCVQDFIEYPLEKTSTALIFAAYNGKKESISTLLNNINENQKIDNKFRSYLLYNFIVQVLIGYALGSHHPEVDKWLLFIEKYKWMDDYDPFAFYRYTVLAYGLAGDIEQINKIIIENNYYETTELLTCAAKGFARRGESHHVKLLLKRGANNSTSYHSWREERGTCGEVWGDFALGGFISLAHQSLEWQEFKNPSFLHILYAYKRADFLTSASSVLELLTLTPYSKSKDRYYYHKEILREVKANDDIKDSLIKKSDQLKNIMSEYKITFDQALASTSQIFNIWILQGRQLLSDGRVKPYFFFKFASYILDSLPMNLTIKIVLEKQERLYGSFLINDISYISGLSHSMFASRQNKARACLEKFKNIDKYQLKEELEKVEYEDKEFFVFALDKHYNRFYK